MQGIISQPGAHAIIYGERGVGKTSLAYIAPIYFAIDSGLSLEQLTSPRINCDSTDTYHDIWRKVFAQIRVTDEQVPMGFVASPEKFEFTLLDGYRDVERFTPGIVTKALEDLSQHCELIITLDEFDRVPGGEVPQLIADTIKSLSDHQVAATIVIVGVGDSVGNLIRGHESAVRHLVEVPLPRMSRDELEKIILDRLETLKMTIDSDAIKHISLVCCGLPYFTHLLGRHAVCKALDGFNLNVTFNDVGAAMKLAIDDSEQTMKSAYYEATFSRHPNASFDETLTSCALAEHDDFGYFTATDIRRPLERLSGANREISAFSSHLDRFEKSRILDVAGDKHHRRFRFRDPLMQPFVLIKALEAGIMSISDMGGV